MSWAARVGIAPKYTWGGPLQLALARIVLADGLPTLINYQRNLTPTPSHPSGHELWSNSGGNQQIGAGYEPWTYSPDDGCLGISTDTFMSGSKPKLHRTTSPSSQAFVDVSTWCRNPALGFSDITAYDKSVYDYSPNAAWGETRYYGHWEEPIVFASDPHGDEFIAFGSSANLTPPWNPLKHQSTFGLDTWLVRVDRASPAVRLTYFNDRSRRTLAYPTTFDPTTSSLYLTVAPGNMGGANPPGAIYRVKLP